MLTIIDSLTNVTIFKSAYILSIVTIINFIYHLTRLYLAKNRKSEKNEVNSYALDKSDNGKYSKYSYAISLIKEAYLLILDFTLIILTLLSNFSFLGQHLRVLIITVIPFMINRFNQLLYEEKPFVENQIIQKNIKKANVVKKIIYYLGYLIVPFAFLTLGGYTQSYFAKNYLYIGIFFLLISKILNLLFKSDSNFSSESIWGSLIEAIGFSGIAGFYFFSNLLPNSSNIILSGSFIPVYITLVILFFAIIIYLISNNNNKD